MQNLTTKTIKMAPPLNLIYTSDQWSPNNTKGKKVYDRDFLMKLQHDPKSKIKPKNLPDLDVVLKDLTKTRNSTDLKIKEVNTNRLDSLYPGFAKPSLSAKNILPSKKNHSGKLKTSKPSVIHMSLSLNEEVKLRETENAWKPTRLVHTSISEEQNKTEALYKKVRSVLNKLTPQKFNTLVNQVRELKIDSQERLQGVIDLVFEKAVDEPNFSEAYALMCKELSSMQVTNDSKDTSTANFRKLILTRCQTEFEKNTADENALSEKHQEISECTDPEKKKELQVSLENEERKMRVKSVGNIRFIGELFKQNMLTCKIMHQCIIHLLHQHDEENLECLCKLLTTIGKNLESKQGNVAEYFKQMQNISRKKGVISSRIRFMLQDVIDLRDNKWIPRRDDSNPKTIDQIQKEAESERLSNDAQLSNISISSLRKEDRTTNDRKRNRVGQTSLEDGWIPAVSKTRQTYSVEPAKLKSKVTSMESMTLGSKSAYLWTNSSLNMPTSNKFSSLDSVTEDKKVPIQSSVSTGNREHIRVDLKPTYDNRSSRNVSHINNNQDPAETLRQQNLSAVIVSNNELQNTTVNSPQLSKDGFLSIFKKFFEKFMSDEEDVDEAVKIFNESFPVSEHIAFVRDSINTIIEKSDHLRNKTSLLFLQLLSNSYLNFIHFKKGVEEILEVAGDLIIDIPKLWKYFAQIIVHPIINKKFTLMELKSTLQVVPSTLYIDGQVAEFIAEILLEIKSLKGLEWTKEMWASSGLKWTDFSDNSDVISRLITKYELDFSKDIILIANENSYRNSKVETIHDQLSLVIKDKQFDDVCAWIKVHMDDKIKEPKYIKTLMTAILENSVEQCSDKWIFKAENFNKMHKLIQRYVDADDFLELQCLFAVQAYILKLNHPAGLIVKIMNHLCENNVLSNEAFLAWEKNDDPIEQEGKMEALSSLKPFFTPLKEGEDISSGEEA